ncbi:anthranilate phosphoribosyltransferase, partial [Pantoea sp. SIMBA_072]
TGGDGSNTINISTTAALVAASMGLAVAKHGNRSVSSRSGSADVLEALKLRVNLDPSDASAQLADNGFCFLFAPHYHPGIKHAMPV